MHERLVEKAHVFVVALQATFHDLVEHVGRLASVLVDQQLPLPRDDLRVEAGAIECQWRRGRDMHGDLPAERLQGSLVALRLEADQHPDLAEPLAGGTVDVGGNHPLADREAPGPAERHVLADGRDRVGDRLGHGPAARICGRHEALDIVGLGSPAGERHRGDRSRQGLEIGVARDEVGFRVELDQDALWTRRHQAHEPFGRDPSRLLGRLGQSLLAQPVDRGLDVTLRFGQRGLAVHHAGAGLLAKILHQGGRIGSHRGSILC